MDVARGEHLDLVRKSYTCAARMLPFDADLEAIEGADRLMLEAETTRDMEAFVGALRELMRAARAEAMRERAGAA